MNKITKKLLAGMLSLVMIFSVMMTGQVKAAETTAAITTATTSTVTFTVEKFTIGQGYLIEPTQVEIKEGDTVASVFEKVTKAKGITYPSTSSSYGFYLSSINNADSGSIDIPKEISLMPDVTLWNGDIAKAPTNEINDGNALAGKGLGTGSYNIMSGWMFMVNNADAGAGADQVKVKNGDVIRLQFSLYGYGADIGFDGSYYGIVSPVLANKDALTKELAKVKAGSAEMLKDDGVQTSVDNAMVVLKSYNVSQAVVDSSLKVLQQAQKSYETYKTKETTTTPVYPTVKRAVVNKITNVKTYKAKVSVKKMANVTGYQYKYANNSKFKQSTTKTTTKTSFTTKKFKKKQKCYAKIRAYAKVNGTRVYGGWSKVKSVKIKK